MAHESPPAPTSSQWRRPWPLLLLVPVLGTAFLLSRHSLSDLDIWLHWRVGQDILAGHLPRTNHYSFTFPDRPWVDHEWLFQVLAALTGKFALWLVRAEGAQALAAGWNALRSVLVMALVLVLGRPLPRNRDAEPLNHAWTLAALMLALGLLWTRMTIRPELLSYLLLALTLPTVESCLSSRSEPANSWRSAFSPHDPCGRLFWLTLLWAQLHGFAVLAPLLLLLAGLLQPVQNRLEGRRTPFPRLRWGRTLLLTCLALGLTPAGWRGWTYPLAVVGQFTGGGPDLQGIISELVPLTRAPDSLAWTIDLYWVCLGWGIVRIVLSWPRPNLLRTALFLATAAAAWAGQRNLGFMAVALVLLQRGDTGPGPDWWRRMTGSGPGRSLAVTVPVILVLGLGLCWGPRIVTDSFYLHEGVGRRWGSGLTPGQYPLAAIDALVEQGSKRVFANLDAAAFVLGNTSCRLFIDGRTEAYPPAAWSSYRQIRAGGPPALEQLVQARVQAVCLAQGSGAAGGLAEALLDSPDRWQMAAAGPGGLLWWRKGQAAPSDTCSLQQAVAAALRQATVETGPTRAADLCLAASRLAMLAGDADLAARALRQGLRRRPDHPSLLHNLGNLELAAGDFSAAGDHFARALEHNPRLAGSALNAGVCALRLGAFGKAARWFQRAVDIDPDDFQGWADLGTARMKSGDRTGAIAAFEKAVALRPQDQRLRRRLRELRGR